MPNVCMHIRSSYRSLNAIFNPLPCDSAWWCRCSRKKWLKVEINKLFYLFSSEILVLNLEFLFFTLYFTFPITSGEGHSPPLYVQKVNESECLFRKNRNFLHYEDNFISKFQPTDVIHHILVSWAGRLWHVQGNTIVRGVLLTLSDKKCMDDL